VEAVKREYPQVEITLVIDPRRSGSNPKIANLMNMMGSVKHDVLVLSDSDIGVAPGYLRGVISALQQDGVGAVSCCYLGKALDNVWSKLSAMGIDYQLLPGALFGLASGLAAPCFGATIAMHRETLAELGGFEALRDVLADDYELGRAVRARGHRVVFPPVMVFHTCTDRSAGELLRHELRWARTIRTVVPQAHLASGVAHAVPLAALGVILTGFSPAGLLVLGAVVGIRLFQKDRLDRAFGTQGFPVSLLFLRDIVSFWVFVSSYFTRQVDWRGDKYRVDLEGSMTHE
jgi:ceramide glucosyltransferase